MHRNFTQLHIHCVWGTWDRLPLVTPDIQEIIYSAIVKQCSDLGCKVIAIGGIVDHVHLNLPGDPHYIGTPISVGRNGREITKRFLTIFLHSRNREGNS